MLTDIIIRWVQVLLFNWFKTSLVGMIKLYINPTWLDNLLSCQQKHMVLVTWLKEGCSLAVRVCSSRRWGKWRLLDLNFINLIHLIIKQLTAVFSHPYAFYHSFRTVNLYINFGLKPSVDIQINSPSGMIKLHINDKNSCYLPYIYCLHWSDLVVTICNWYHYLCMIPYRDNLVSKWRSSTRCEICSFLH